MNAAGQPFVIEETTISTCMPPTAIGALPSIYHTRLPQPYYRSRQERTGARPGDFNQRARFGGSRPAGWFVCGIRQLSDRCTAFGSAKDNYDLAGLQTRVAPPRCSAGFLRRRTIIAKLRAAGAIVIAKVTMSEWARGSMDNINSVLPGFAPIPTTRHTRRADHRADRSRHAADYGVIGLGSDTWGSIRNPPSNNAIVGLRPSWALVSRAGMIGLYYARDMAGPMTRTVTDLAKILDVIAGRDSADPATAGAAGKISATMRLA